MIAIRSPRDARVRPRVGFILVVFGFIIAAVAWPGVAAAGLTLSSASIEGVTSTSSPPGGVLRAEVTGKATAGAEWQGTQYRFGADPRQCVDTDDSKGNKTVEFNITAPGDPGDYDAGFTARARMDVGARRATRRC